MLKIKCPAKTIFEKVCCVLLNVILLNKDKYEYTILKFFISMKNCLVTGKDFSEVLVIRIASYLLKFRASKCQAI